MTEINSISDLLTLSGCQFVVYDLGRKVNLITNEIFAKVEDGCQWFGLEFISYKSLSKIFRKKVLSLLGFLGKFSFYTFCTNQSMIW